MKITLTDIYLRKTKKKKKKYKCITIKYFKIIFIIINYLNFIIYLLITIKLKRYIHIITLCENITFMYTRMYTYFNAFQVAALIYIENTSPNSILYTSVRLISI